MEICKDVKGYEGLYQVSNFGRIKSLHKIRNRGDNADGIMKTYLIHGNYIAIKLKKNKESKAYLIHRLVAISFIPNPEDKRTVNHIDGNKLNNHVNNLEWNTHSENLHHAYNNGLSVYRAYRKDTGIHIRCRSVIQINIDGSVMAEFESLKEAEEKTGIKQTNISNVCRGKRLVAGGFKWKYKDKKV